MARYGSIGGNHGYSQLRRIHNEIAGYEYDELDVPENGDLGSLLADTRYTGFNISNPYRYEVLNHLDEISDDARKSGAVDVVRRLPDGRLAGFNTYMYSFRYMVEGFVEDKKCVILGTGGAATSAARALKELGAREIVLVSRDPAAAAEKTVPGDIRLGDIYEITGYNRLYMHYDAEVIINCTPVGRSPDRKVTCRMRGVLPDVTPSQGWRQLYSGRSRPAISGSESRTIWMRTDALSYRSSGGSFRISSI